jgi:hypothetical protein
VSKAAGRAGFLGVFITFIARNIGDLKAKTLRLVVRIYGAWAGIADRAASIGDRFRLDVAGRIGELSDCYWQEQSLPTTGVFISTIDLNSGLAASSKVGQKPTLGFVQSVADVSSCTRLTNESP